MRAWAEMFDAFLSALGRPRRRHLALHRRRLLRPRRRQAPLRRACATCSRRAASSCPRATRPTRPTPTPCAAWATARTTPSTWCSRATASTAYPGSVALLDALRDLRMPLAVVSSSANAPAVLAAAGLADRFVTVVDGRVATALGPARQARPRHLRARRHRVRHHAGPLGRRRGRRLRRAGRRRRRVRRWSSASTAGPAPTRSPPPGPTSSSADLGGPRVKRPPAPRPTRSTAAASPSTRGAWSSATPTARDLGVTETLFTVANGYLGMRGNPEEGRDALRARHLRQRASTRPGRSGTPRRPSASPAPGRPSSTPPTPS